MQRYKRHIQARLVGKLERHDKTAPGMQDLAQEVSTKGAMGERRNTVYKRQDAKNENDVLQHHGGHPDVGGAGESRRGGEGSTLERIPLRQSYPVHAGSAWGGFEDAMAKWSYTEKRLPTVSTCDTIGRTPVRPDRERAPVWVTDRGMGRWQGLEGASTSITGVESSVEACRCFRRRCGACLRTKGIGLVNGLSAVSATLSEITLKQRAVLTLMIPPGAGFGCPVFKVAAQIKSSNLQGVKSSAQIKLRSRQIYKKKLVN
ncbi:hypothetical protein DFH06DRAFT_1145392 [Mycena polygramma]|nr:hypothetical protein DFH06DRAFT_1145392 [Mycena polygramma]